MCKDKYLKGCKALGCDGYGVLCDGMSCREGDVISPYPLVLFAVQNMKDQAPHCEVSISHLQLSAGTRKHLTDQLGSAWGTGMVRG